MTKKLIKLPEPTLLFGHDQAIEDPRDGLTLFGPLDEGKTYGVRAGVIGTKDGIRYYKEWVERLQLPIYEIDEKKKHLKENRPLFPGFETAFGIPWNSKPVIEIAVDEEEIDKAVYIGNSYLRIFRTVDIFAKRIIKAKNEEDAEVDVWFVIIPEKIYKYCRPKSEVEVALRLEDEELSLTLKEARNIQKGPSLFPEMNALTLPYEYELNFHNQLKARLLEDKILTQIVRETTLAPYEFTKANGRPLRPLGDLSAVAWRLSTGVFYKTGGRPWKIDNIRNGVCYIGLVYKQDGSTGDPRSACCAAQMFLDSGDGVVFKGNVGPWFTPGTGDYHLDSQSAAELVGKAVETYTDKMGEPPKELFLHGKVMFNNEEWQGFNAAIEQSRTNLVGVKIYTEKNFKLYRKGKMPVVRGTAYIRSWRKAYLWTNGYVPRLKTFPGMGVPKPLFIDVCRGDVNIETVLKDVLALTKLNYNTCQLADGQPVTLKFAEAVGEILTAGPLKNVPPLPFKHYI